MKKLTLLLGIFLCPLSLFAQNSTGIPPFSSLSSSGFDTVNNQNLNAYFAIPLVASPGRSIPLNLTVSYNSLIWQKTSSGTIVWTPVTDANGNPTWGWAKDFPGGQPRYKSVTQTIKCFPPGSPWFFTTKTTYSNFYYVDVLGTGHPFRTISFVDDSNCSGNITGTIAGSATDNSGYYMDGSGALGGGSPVVTSPTGVSSPSGTVTDSNGNYVTKTVVSSTETDWKDSVGNAALKILYTPNSTNPTQIQYQFLDGTGASNYQTITMSLQSLSISTAFGCSGVGEYTGTALVPQTIQIPTPAGGHLTYNFTYDTTNARLKKVTLPTGGSYEYDYTGGNSGINCSDGTTVGMNRVVSDGTNTATWNFVRNVSNLTTTTTTPQLSDTPNANDTVYTFNSSGQEISRKVYANSPGTTLLRTVNTTWASNGTPATQVTILEDNSTQAETDTTFDSNGLLDSMSEYDFGSGTHGGLIRTTTLSYQTSSNYTSRNIINLVTSKIVKDGSGATQYRQDTTYDGVALANCPTGVPQHDDTNYACSMNYRGNPTSVTTYLTPATPANGITKNFTYDIFGNLLTAQLNCCQNKTWTYSATTQYSRPDSVTRGSSPTQLTTSATYNAYTGLVATSTDENNQVTNYYYDFLRRPTSVVRQADSATITYSYDDVHFTATTKSPIDSAKFVQQVSALDGLGRAVTSTTEDGNSNVISVVSFQYDLLGRSYKASNPYTGSPSYWTTTQFDLLGRPTSATLPDNSATTYSYATNTATVTDPAGKKRKSQSDATGRLAVVTEPDSSNNLTQTTSYTYSVLDALSTVIQGSQTRTYQYDALGRLTSATTPESGTVCLGTLSGSTCQANGYDSFDNLLYRTDARGVLTSYSYDGLNRLYQISYNVGTSGVPATPTVTLTYGTSASQFNNGRLITMADGVGSENYSYNNLGQMTQLQKVISGTTYAIGYAYNIAGELTQITYPSGRAVQQSFDATGRLCEIAPSTTGCSTAASPYATAFGYNTASQVTGFNYGNGVGTAIGYSPDRLQMTALQYAKGGTTLFNLTYAYGSAGSNNGQISGITDGVDNGRNVNYGYDPLARLSTALTVGSANYPQWGLSMTYDRYGNRTAQTVTAGTGPSNSVSVDATTNRIVGLGYDANGNMTNDGSNSLVYDAENRALSATNASTSGTYTYDGNGLRVTKVAGGTTTVYVFSGGKVIAEYDNGAGVASPSREYIYSGAQLLAKIESGGTTYYHADHLSARLLTDSSGNTLGQRGHFPFGETWYETGTTTKFKFTTYEHDAESGNDYALARYSVNRLGRFSSPDPVAGSNGNPQLLDRYSYVTNDPTNLADPSGLCPSPAAAPIFFANHTACTSAAPSVAMQTLLVFGYSASVGSDSEGLFWSWGFGLLGAFT